MNMAAIRAAALAMRKKIVALRETDMSVTQVAAELGVTKGVVAGHLNRAGITCGANNPMGNGDRRVRFRPVPVAQSEEVVQMATPAPTERRTEATRLSRVTKCQWIEGDATHDDLCKCLDPAQEGSSFCPDHHTRVWTKAPRRYKGSLGGWG